VSGGKGLKGSVEEGLSAFSVEPVGHFNANFARAGGTLGAGVEIAESATAHGGRLAMESAGHDVTTFVDHEVLSCGGQAPPFPHPVCLGQILCFQRVEDGDLA
jgi:hypothetical protein